MLWYTLHDPGLLNSEHMTEIRNRQRVTKLTVYKTDVDYYVGRVG